MKFSLAIQKKNRSNLGTVEGHNKRAHATASQLPKTAWITAEGWHEIVPFNANLLEHAKSLSKRKDMVLAVELVIQVGNQTDWREMPTPEHPEGRKKPGTSEKLNALIAGVKQAAFEEFGKERIISVDLHTDESTPHAHIVFAPILNNKLQAKNWLDGSASCAILREKLHAHVNKHIACDYTKGALGGKPHDATKAAGAVNALKPEPKPFGLIGKALDAINSIQEVKDLKQEVKKLQDTILDLSQQLQNAFSRAKAAEKAFEAERAARLLAMKSSIQSARIAEEKDQEIEELRDQVMALTPAPTPVKNPQVVREVKPPPPLDPMVEKTRKPLLPR